VYHNKHLLQLVTILKMVENVWGLVAVLIFYLIILIVGIVAGRKQLARSAKSSTTETMLAGRNIGMV